MSTTPGDSDAADEDDTAAGPLLPGDREEVLEQLQDLEVFQALLAPRGVLGLVLDCDTCRTTHYQGWALLRSNLRQLLDLGTTPVHEQALLPDEARYVSVDYARGFADCALDG